MKNISRFGLMGVFLTVSGMFGPVFAETASAPAGATFFVGDACTVTGATLSVGTFTAGQTFATYGAKQGYVNGDAGYAFTAGSAAPGKLASVNCSLGTPWLLHLDGGGFQGNTLVRNGTIEVNTSPRAADIDGSTSGWSGGALRTESSGLASVGTGKEQVVNGMYTLFTYPGEDYIPKIILQVGTYTGTNTARLDF